VQAEDRGVGDARGRVTAGDVLTLSELRALRRTSTLRGVGLLVHAWAVIAGAMVAYALWPSVVTLVVAVLVVGGRQVGLAVLMHEAAHWLLLPRPRANTRVGAWLCAYPVGEDLAGYRRRHHLHHRHTQQPEDPDLALAAAWPVGPGAWWWTVLRDLGGVTSGQALLGWRPWRKAELRRLRGPLAVNAAVFGVLAVAGQWHLYALLWLLPLATWYCLATRLRTFAEHALVPAGDDPLQNARTTAAGLLARALLAPYWVNYHLEHHLAVFVPCWRLPAVHSLLLARGHGAHMAMAPGYTALIRPAATASAAS
jgi:fatty acid desaturase